MGKEIRVEGREENKINGRIYTPGNHWKFPDNLVNVDFRSEITSTFRTI